MVETEIVILGLLLLVTVYVFFSLIMKSIKFLAVNALVGFVILYLSNFVVGLNIPYSLPVVLICAILGAPGAITVIMMRLFGLAF
ncbi:MAG: pro-sigmaK processing inhibitor BofA family protein [Methanotrichaceae archaeon]|mgnify:CR=1 FL=1